VEEEEEGNSAAAEEECAPSGLVLLPPQPAWLHVLLPVLVVLLVGADRGSVVEAGWRCCKRLHICCWGDGGKEMGRSMLCLFSFPSLVLMEAAQKLVPRACPPPRSACACVRRVRVRELSCACKQSDSKRRRRSAKQVE